MEDFKVATDQMSWVWKHSLESSKSGKCMKCFRSSRCLKFRASRHTKLESYVKDFGSDIISTDGVVLLCRVCEKEIRVDKKFQVTQHLNGLQHKSAEQRKLELNSTEKFLRNYCKQPVPSSATLRRGYLKSIYESKVDFIRTSVADEPIWISMDETTDSMGRFVAHTIVGTLETSLSKSFLLNAECLEKTNSTTISQAFMNSLSLLWPDGVRHAKVLLFVTDGAAYMRKAGSVLQVLFSKMLHLTCAAHAVHRIAEEIRSKFPDVDELISNGKKIFLKSAARVTVFREIATGVPLPPQPILTRWGTWLNAAKYYAEHFVPFSNVVHALDANDAASIREALDLLKRPAVKEDLAFLRAFFDCVPRAIEKSETTGAPLTESINVFETLLEELRKTPGDIGECVRKKCAAIVARNCGYGVLKKVSNVLRGDNTQDGPVGWDP
ncbi:uncharacterized protein LOC100904551 [Galendromus occidentalis]|uniref:Uncharacterized protein LOC100904551 n=1 Tax=Galendromus occidentalis TaxID=34638 RepID=A0AAJ6VWP7_9ACAR|nr:uncharacterized protein LOC100904551 [Galendromus occidentalis]